MIEGQCCGNCRFARRVMDLGSVECRYGPPSVTTHFVNGKAIHIAAFPLLKRDNVGCWQYEPEKKDPPQESCGGSREEKGPSC